MGKGLKGAALRTAVLGASIGAAAAACSSGCDIFSDDGGGFAAALLFLGAGVVTTSVLAIRDIVRVDDAVRARNLRRAGPTVSLGLRYVPEARAPVLGLTLRH